MELWIRSQDKKHLMKSEAFVIEGVGDNRFGIRVFTKNYDFNIANYDTKERALEILDEIQQRIIELDKAVIYSHMPEEDYLNVYEMPEE